MGESDKYGITNIAVNCQIGILPIRDRPLLIRADQSVAFNL